MTEVIEGAAIVPSEARNLTIAEVKGNVARIKALLQDVMIGPTKDNKVGVHYGTIPGTPKPTLYQAGAELILMMFRLEAYPVVEDLSTKDVIRYRVKTQIKHQLTGLSLGWGIGECSSDEEKYRWRKVVVDAEYESEDPARRRNVWKKGNPPYQVKQVRTHPADVANTILKMAHKRSVVGGVRSVTAASDVFDQGADDLSPEMRAEIYGEGGPEDTGAAATRPAAVDAGAPKVEQQETNLSGKLASDAQLRIIRSKMTNKSISDVEFCKFFKIAAIELLPFEHVNDAIKWIDEKK